MDFDGLLAETKRRFEGADTAHDISHAQRVARLAQYIAEHEGYDPMEAEIAGLLHDMGRTVQREDKNHGPAGVPLASELLDRFTDYDEATKQRILAAVRDHSKFKAEGKLTHIVQDADKLDGLGAIGVARAYMHRSYLPIYDSSDLLPKKASVDLTSQAHLMWMLEWVGMMETKTGRKLAEKRGAFMENFMHQIAREATADDL